MTDMTCSYIKPMVGILTSETQLLDRVLSLLSQFFGPADIVGEWREFEHTRYYEDEMGAGLYRCFVSFSEIVSADRAACFKDFTRGVEKRFCECDRRRVNIDPGYIDSFKVVLISGKCGGHRIVLAPSAFADLLLWYDKGWKPMPWTFPDFQDGSHFPVFLKMRSEFKKQVKDAEAKEKSIFR